MNDRIHGCGCDSIPPQDIIACLCELRHTIERVQDCVGKHFHSKDRIVVCIILEEIRQIEKILKNPIFGLPEIKNEIRAIENAIQNPASGLNEIKNEIRSIENILNNTIFGLPEIKNEIRAIENAIQNPASGLNEIKNEIRNIENVLSNLNITVNIPNEIIGGINDIINNPAFGLNEIKTEIRTIENAIFSPEFGLNEIKNEIRGIENTLANFNFNISFNIAFPNEIIGGINDIINNETFGLNEIKNEIRFIENAVTPPSALTTGPVMAAVNANRLRVKVLNNTPANQTVTIRVFNLENCPKCNNELFNSPLGPIPPSCARETGNIDLTTTSEYEVEVSDLVPGVYIWSTAFPSTEPRNFIGVNTFRHADFVPQIFNNC
jgi:translation elongation factor EF-1beta